MTTRPAEGSTLKRCCQECGGVLTVTGSRGKTPKFCKEACRTAFNMRRRQRGAQLFDLFMANSFERSAPARVNGSLRRAMGRLASRWRDEDFRERGGRNSWGDYRETLQNDLTLTASYGGTRQAWSAGREPSQSSPCNP
jgi:hypothetical protein